MEECPRHKFVTFLFFGEGGDITYISCILLPQTLDLEVFSFLFQRARATEEEEKERTMADMGEGTYTHQELDQPFPLREDMKVEFL